MSVYFVTCREANAVKIGSSLEPHARLKEIQCGCPLLLKLEAMVPGNVSEERAMHERFDDVRIRGEWFALTPMIEAIIEANPPGPEPVRVSCGKPTLRERLNARRRREREAAKAAADLVDSHERAIRKLESRGDIHFPFRAQE